MLTPVDGPYRAARRPDRLAAGGQSGFARLVGGGQFYARLLDERGDLRSARAGQLAARRSSPYPPLKS